MPILSPTPLKILAIPAFQDNYFWLIHDNVHAAIVDPGDAEPVLATLAHHGLSLTAILLTHHHHDHVNGVPKLLHHFNVPVFGPARESITGITHPLTEHDSITLPHLNLNMSIIDVPGHTLGHIAYYAPDAGWLFCGDTLFAAGCGRLFEGTPQQMFTSLQKLAALPNNTQFFCAHEYTLSNLRFAQTVEPNNPAIAQRIRTEQGKRARDLPTLPSTIGLEKKTNPFLRCQEPSVLQQLHATEQKSYTEPVAVFAALRKWKDHF